MQWAQRQLFTDLCIEKGHHRQLRSTAGQGSRSGSPQCLGAPWTHTTGHSRCFPIKEALSHRDSGGSHVEARVMPFPALAPLSALLGRWPLAPKLGKLVAMGVPGSRPSRAASMRRVDGSGQRGHVQGKVPGRARPGNLLLSLSSAQHRHLRPASNSRRYSLNIQALLWP